MTLADNQTAEGALEQQANDEDLITLGFSHEHPNKHVNTHCSLDE